ncbi:MAG TPA: helix-turn-helix domain-containing protein, partial [Saprospiraceae bacterium]|nr:helix-turn-helix domain-containing protein [Saprospiraceae bacterium]
QNQPLIAWLKKQHLEYGTELASLCSGAFFIAATGLADGKKMTTHWMYAGAFKALFPKVKLLSDRIVTDDGGIYASGGAYSSLNLILYLLEKFCDKTTALWASKVFQIDLHRNSQKPFVIFNNQKSHVDEQIKKVQDYIEQNFDHSLTVNELAAQFAFSRRNFLRRFKEATGNTPIEYLQRMRIEAAKRLLENSPKNVEEVVAATGYSDSKTFRLLFKKHTGFSPLAYRVKYRQG